MPRHRDNDEYSSHWRVNRNIPVAVLLALGVQAVVIIWGYAGLSYAVQDIQQWRVGVDKWREAQTSTATQLAVMDAKVVQLSTDIKTQSEDIKRLLIASQVSVPSPAPVARKATPAMLR